LVGLLGVLLLYFYVFNFLVGPDIAVLFYDFCFSYRSFHEDGFADVCDGFGLDQRKNLMIMKDSNWLVYWFNLCYCY
jgi:cobalamin synthase